MVQFWAVLTYGDELLVLLGLGDEALQILLATLPTLNIALQGVDTVGEALDIVLGLLELGGQVIAELVDRDRGADQQLEVELEGRN